MASFIRRLNPFGKDQKPTDVSRLATVTNSHESNDGSPGEANGKHCFSDIQIYDVVTGVRHVKVIDSARIVLVKSRKMERNDSKLEIQHIAYLFDTLSGKLCQNVQLNHSEAVKCFEVIRGRNEMTDESVLYIISIGLDNVLCITTMTLALNYSPAPESTSQFYQIYSQSKLIMKALQTPVDECEILAISQCDQLSYIHRDSGGMFLLENVKDLETEAVAILDFPQSFVNVTTKAIYAYVKVRSTEGSRKYDLAKKYHVFTGAIITSAGTMSESTFAVGLYNSQVQIHSVESKDVLKNVKLDLSYPVRNLLFNKQKKVLIFTAGCCLYLLNEELSPHSWDKVEWGYTINQAVLANSNVLVIRNNSGSLVNVFDLSSYNAYRQRSIESTSAIIRHAGKLVIHNGDVQHMQALEDGLITFGSDDIIAICRSRDSVMLQFFECLKKDAAHLDY